MKIVWIIASVFWFSFQAIAATQPRVNTVEVIKATNGISSGLAILTDTLSGTNVAVDFNHSSIMNLTGFSAGRYHLVNTPSGTNKQSCELFIIGAPGTAITNVADSITFHGEWGVLREATNRIYMLWNGTSLEAWQEPNYGQIFVTTGPYIQGLWAIMMTNPITGSYAYISTNGSYHASNAVTGGHWEGTNGGFNMSSNLYVAGSGIRFSGLGGSTGYLAIDASGNITPGTISGAGTGNMINSGTPVVGNVPRYTDTSGTALSPSQVTFDGSGNMSNIVTIAINKNAIGITETNALSIINQTAAAAGAQQQSGARRMGGNAWITTAGGSSVPVFFDDWVLPLQGVTGPTAKYQLASSINNSVPIVIFSVDNAGSGLFSADVTVASSFGFRVSGRSEVKSSSNGHGEIVDAAGTSPSTWRAAWETSSKTANYPVVVLDSGTFFNNIGASGSVNFTLPTASAGLHYSFTIQAAQTVTVTAGSSTTIRSGANVTAAAGNITSSSVGNTIHIFAISATEWYTEAIVGSWTFN